VHTAITASLENARGARPDAAEEEGMFKRWFGIKVLLAFIAFTGVAQAQTATYYADDLANEAKTILVSPGYLTLIEFYQEVDSITSGRPGLLKVDVPSGSGSKVFVSTLASSGSTDLIIEIGARVQLFRVQITQGSAPRRYVDDLEKPAPPTKPTAPVATPSVSAPKPSARVSSVRPVSSTPVVTMTPAPPAAVATPGPAVSAAASSTNSVTAVTSSKPEKRVTQKTVTQPKTTAASTPAKQSTTPQSNTAPAAGERNPSWLAFTFVRAQIEPEQMTMYFTLKNTGKAQVLIDPTRLTASQGGQKLDSVLASDTTSGLLKPGSTRIIRLIVKKPKSGAIFLSWSVFGQDLREYALSRRIDVTNNQVVSGG
jgi:hypothetical protein